MSGQVEHSHAEGEFDPGCPACTVQAAEDYVRFSHMLGDDERRMP